MYNYTDLENYTKNTNTTNLKSWNDVYHIFMDISSIVLDTNINHDVAHIVINKWVDAIYLNHKGDRMWDVAYERWTED